VIRKVKIFAERSIFLPLIRLWFWLSLLPEISNFSAIACVFRRNNSGKRKPKNKAENQYFLQFSPSEYLCKITHHIRTDRCDPDQTRNHRGIPSILTGCFKSKTRRKSSTRLSTAA
jgi:hypothetical protein